MTMSQVVKRNTGYLQLLACCPQHQRQLLLETATPQQMHAIVQAIHNVLHSHVPVTEEFRGGGFIQLVLTPVIASLGFLML